MCIDIECIEGQGKLLDILKSYFRNTAKYDPKPEDAGKTTYFSLVGKDFLLKSTYALCKLQSTSPPFSQHQNLLQHLTSSLQDLQNDPTAHPSSDYLFFASLTYILWLLRWGRDAETVKTDIHQHLILAILQYHARTFQLRRDIKNRFYDTSVFTFEWDWPDFIRLAEGLGVVLPPPAGQTLPADIQDCHHPAGDVQVEVRV